MLGFEQEGITVGVDVGANDGKASQRYALEVVRHESQELRIRSHGARDHAALGLHAAAKCGTGVPELLVGDESSDKHLARLVGREAREVVLLVQILLPSVLGKRDAALGDKRRSLHVQKRGGNQHKVARNVQVQVAHALDLGKVLVCHLGNRDGANGHLLPTYELQKEVEGTRVRICLHTP